jgi:selenocysteine lyase/cysteine desulfurase
LLVKPPAVPDWSSIRASQFPVAEDWIYLDHAAVAPLPHSAARTLRHWADRIERQGVLLWPEVGTEIEDTRQKLAMLINAHRDEIALTASTTHGIGLVAEGFPWQPGDNVVTAADEYPSNLYPWMNLASRGVSTRIVPCQAGRVSIDDLAAAIDGPTRLLAISHVEFATGFRNDLDRLGGLCRERGIAFFVDAIQGLGPHTIDVSRTPIDFLAADGHKWLLGPEGAGMLFVSRPWIERLRPIGVGWHSVLDSYQSSEITFRLKPSAERWEGGSFNMPGHLTLGASLELLHAWGPANVSERILERARAVRAAARTAGWSLFGSDREADQSGIVVIERAGVDPVDAVRRLRAARIIVACRRGRVRLSAHLYNDDADLSELERVLAQIV